MKPASPFLEVVSSPPDPDPEVERLFASARDLAEPNAENRRRVSRALRAALPELSGSMLAGRGLGSSRAEPPSGTDRSSIVASGPSFSSRVVRWPSAALLLGGVLLGALGFWLGHGVGYTAGVDAARQPEAGATRGELAPPDLLPIAPAAGAEQTSRRGAPDDVERSTPQGVPAEAVPPMSVAPVSRPPGKNSKVTRAARATRDGSSTARASAVVPVDGTAQSPSFRQVLEQLRRAQQQLRNGQATMSLLVLSELDRGAGELLREERETTRVLALCAAGEHAAAREAAARIEQATPQSIYGMRLAASCVSDDGATDF
jgi:hypothetical protein